MTKRMLVLENGRVFYGDGFGSEDTRIAEIVFNTSMVGYQEILSDPSYCGQLVVMSYPLIGNYGLADEDYESKNIYHAGFVVREYNDVPSNFRFTMTLGDIMAEYHMAGISGVDTREIVRIIRKEGTMKAMITSSDRSVDDCLKELAAFKVEKNQVQNVSCKKIWYSRTRNPEYTVVVVDCGVKFDTLRLLNQNACNVVVVPYTTSVEQVLKFCPNGVVISDGPGDPTQNTEVVQLIRDLKGNVPILGIGTGCQLIGLAYGAKTFKLRFGHHGGNLPVMDLRTDTIEVANQNRSYGLAADSLSGTGLEVTHVNLIDRETEGVEDLKNNVIGIQFHPTGTAGPANSRNVLDEFTEMMKLSGGDKNAKKNRY